MSQQLRRQRSYPYCGRLVVMETGRIGTYDPFPGFDNLASIDFPAMPDSIELARSAEYMVVNNQMMPDGFHQYKWTNVAMIPFSFKLHSFDKEFCPEGALSVLKTAALLESFVVPLSGSKENSGITVTANSKYPGEKPSNSASSEAQRAESAEKPYAVGADLGADFSPPVTLRLELIFTGEGLPGIYCVGYVKDVKAKLNGPWMRGPRRSQNLPTSGDFDFTFVHVPSQTNNYQITSSPVNPSSLVSQTYADDVKKLLFNTRHLAVGSYKGFGNAIAPNYIPEPFPTDTVYDLNSTQHYVPEYPLYTAPQLDRMQRYVPPSR